MKTCPACGVEVNMSALVESFGVPEGWDFWGKPGSRWISCRSEVDGVRYTHFKVALKNGRQHRMAMERVT